MTAAAARLREPLRAPVLVGLAGAALAAALLAQDPHAGGWPGCVFLRLTGIPCPGCGGLRASHDLLTADLGAALSTNAYAVLTAALVAIGYAAWLAAAVRGRRPRWQRHVPVIAMGWMAGLLAFGVLRLLPALSVLRP